MDISTIEAAIATLGVPVVFCGVLAYGMLYLFKTLMARMDAQDQRHKEEIDKLSTALTNNTATMVEVTAAVNMLREEVKRINEDRS